MALSLQTGELRRDTRVAFQRRAWCEHRDWTLYLCVGNLSRAGLFIQTFTPFARGELLRVCLASAPLDDGLVGLERNPSRGPLIELDVEVMWFSPRGRAPGVGCSIRSFSQGQAQYLELVEQLAQVAR